MKNILIALTTLMIAGLAQAQSATGTLQVNGTAGKFQIFQKAKAVRCDTTKRGACDNPVYLELNKPLVVAAGTYIVGFENSLNPDLVNVSAGGNTTLTLEKITVPAGIVGKKILVTRDFNSAIEQNKIMMSMFYMNRHFFRLEKENFGELYLTGAWERDFTQRFSYETCANLAASVTTNPEPSKEAGTVCNAWNTATRPSQLAPLFYFNPASMVKDVRVVRNTFIENWVTKPGDTSPVEHPQYMVSAPITDQDFVSVFAGSYKIQAENNGVSQVIRAGR